MTAPHFAWGLALAAAAGLTASGCKEDDPCAGKQEVCIDLEVDGNVGILDQLRVVLDGRMALTPAMPSAFLLPARVALLPWPETYGQTLTLEVTSLHDGEPTGYGQTSVKVPSSDSGTAVVFLEPGSGQDGGADAGREAGVDAGIEAGSDQGADDVLDTDAGPDASVDAPDEAAADAEDSGSDTAGSDVPPAATCDEYCDKIQTACTGSNVQYADRNLCMTSCMRWYGWASGSPTDTMHNSLACRVYHSVAASAGTPEIHCPHAGASGGNMCGSWCTNYCYAAMRNCTGANTIYTDPDMCLVTCVSIAATGRPNDTAGNTVQCRIYHLGLAGESPDQAGIHCPHGRVISDVCQ